MSDKIFSDNRQSRAEATWENGVLPDILSDDAKAQELPLVIQAVIDNITEDGISLDEPANNMVAGGLAGLVNSKEFLEVMPGAKAIIEDGVVDLEETLTILSEVGIAYFDNDPMIIDAGTSNKIEDGLKEMGIEPNDRLVEGLVKTETIFQVEASKMPAAQFNGVAPDNPVDNAIDLKIQEPDFSETSKIAPLPYNGMGQ